LLGVQGRRNGEIASLGPHASRVQRLHPKPDKPELMTVAQALGSRRCSPLDHFFYLMVQVKVYASTLLV
jgi:hypothetical protein